MSLYKLLETKLYNNIKNFKDYLANNKNEIKEDLKVLLSSLFLTYFSYFLKFYHADKIGHITKGFLTTSLFYHIYKLFFKDEKWKYLSILNTVISAFLWEYLETIFLKEPIDPYDILADSLGAIFYVIYKMRRGWDLNPRGHKAHRLSMKTPGRRPIH